MTDAERAVWIEEFKRLRYLYQRAEFHRKPTTIAKLREARLAKRTWYGLEENDLRIKIDKLLTASSV
jgi:hypothetical protein